MLAKRKVSRWYSLDLFRKAFSRRDFLIVHAKIEIRVSGYKVLERVVLLPVLAKRASLHSFFCHRLIFFEFEIHGISGPTTTKIFVQDYKSGYL